MGFSLRQFIERPLTMGATGGQAWIGSVGNALVAPSLNVSNSLGGVTLRKLVSKPLSGGFGNDSVEKVGSVLYAPGATENESGPSTLTDLVSGKKKPKWIKYPLGRGFSKTFLGKNSAMYAPGLGKNKWVWDPTQGNDPGAAKLNAIADKVSENKVARAAGYAIASYYTFGAVSGWFAGSGAAAGGSSAPSAYGPYASGYATGSPAAGGYYSGNTAYSQMMTSYSQAAPAAGASGLSNYGPYAGNYATGAGSTASSTSSVSNVLNSLKNAGKYAAENFALPLALQTATQMISGKGAAGGIQAFGFDGSGVAAESLTTSGGGGGGEAGGSGWSAPEEGTETPWLTIAAIAAAGIAAVALIARKG